MLLQLEHIFKTYGEGQVAVPVLKDVSFCANEGDYIAIMGPSGSGKTTLMNIIGCLDKASQGTYQFEDENVFGMNEDQLSDLYADDSMGAQNTEPQEEVKAEAKADTTAEADAKDID